MTRTQHTTRSCSSSSSSSNDLQHAQQRRRRQMSTQFFALLLLLLISCSAAATAQSRYYYTSTSDAQHGASKVRTQRQAAASASATTASVIDETADASSCCQGAAAAGAEPVTLSLELSNVTTEYTDVEGKSSSREQFKRSADQPPLAMAASCSPQPTIVDLNVGQEEAEQSGGNVRYAPVCTRVNRCSGCCGSTLIACQPTETEALQMRVRKLDGSNSKKKVYVIVTVEQHVKCKCDCRIRAEDCNSYQEYRKDLCRCECQNTDARDKCLEQSENKYWDDANCTCACRYNQSCTTGTIFDESQCKCTDPSAPSDYSDRRRFIVQAIPVEPDNSTLYTV
ncbi:hypothetical protein KR215_011365 [Drosophila sulfurigaster]|nr:hypothetical protein KR215_011365 [Drosophila sulfurigaster]